ncbi:hypothetical protein HN587_00110 [Candidatus Woesearchaeota archaeon]|jgi:hypothetical protein|nr:hypothetical protein [Candidatus Woesearchaeota archaeon]
MAAKKSKKPISSKSDNEELLNLKIKLIERRIKEGESLVNFDTGYVHFLVILNANGKNMEFEKRIRLDKPEKMTKKFISKMKLFAETRYNERTYFIAQKTAPEKTLTNLRNLEAVEEGLMQVFSEVNQFMKTKKASIVKTTILKF